MSEPTKGIRNGRRRTAVAFFGVVLMGVLWLLWQATRSPALPIGATLPALGVMSPEGLSTLAATAGDRRLLLIVFRSDCEACEGQLGQLDSALGMLPPDLDVVALTGESLIPFQKLEGRWPRLSAHPTFSWAKAEGGEVSGLLGVRLTPTLLLFAPNNVLLKKHVGVIDISAFVSE